MYMSYQRATVQPSTVQITIDRLKRIAKLVDGEQLPLTVEKLIEVKTAISRMRISQGYKRSIYTAFAQVLNFGTRFYGLDSKHKALKNFSKARRIRRPVLTPEEFEKLRSYLEDDLTKAFFGLLYYGGLRRGEALALKATDLTGNTVSITKTYTNRKVGPVKTAESNRAVAVPASVAAEIRQIARGKGRIFQSLSYTSLKRKFDTALYRAGLPEMRLHDLRHSHITYLLQEGFTPQAIAHRVGHADTDTLLNVYAEYQNREDAEISAYLEAKRPSRM